MFLNYNNLNIVVVPAGGMSLRGNDGSRGRGEGAAGRGPEFEA